VGARCANETDFARFGDAAEFVPPFVVGHEFAALP
jgi:hypothetical protein